PSMADTRVTDELAAFAPLAHSSSEAARRSSKIVDEADSNLIAHWTRGVTNSLPADPDVARALVVVRISASHLPGDSGAAGIELVGPGRANSAVEASCGRCHESAWAKWKDS